jgi:hypothetical protein
MGSIMFIVLKAAKVVDTPFDFPLLCLLVSIDSVSFVSLLRYWQRKRS